MYIRHRWKGLIALVLALILCAAPALAVTPSDYNKNMPQVLEADHLYGEAAVVMDADTHEVLFSKNSRVRMYPASTTKIMTLLLALESGIPLDTVISVPKQAMKVPKDSSLIPILTGDEMTFRDLLYGTMINSGNDGANAVAVIVSGSIDLFVERMNRRAAALGCRGTHFANAHGYHNEDHYSTAQDLALITAEALKHDAIRQIVTAQSHTMNIMREGKQVQINLNTRNSLLKEDNSFYYEDCIGVKSGFHSNAGYCFVSAAERDGVRLVAVTLNCAKDSYKYYDLIRGMQFGFTRYTEYTMEQMFGFASDQIATVKISNASSDDPYGGLLDMNIAQISDSDYSRMVQTGNTGAMDAAIADFVSRSQLVITDNLAAPISEGEILGNFSYIAQNGQRITALLVASRAVAEEPERFGITDMFPFLIYLENPLVRALLIVLAVLIVLIILSGMMRRARRERRRREIYEARKQAYMRRQRMEARMIERERKEMRRRPNTKVPVRRRTHARREEDEDDIFGGF
ncbi:MAG: D-alanyl-D-alanine carboxypeptidase [Clostridia bacterium]|nr:D-alanyl-D-alanine carboxypeptidase [Clostridia bacterium]